MRQLTAQRLARLGVTALIVGIGISQVIFALGDWHLSDMGAYWNAAHRIRDGEALYPALADAEASTVYRYAPWFAWAWVPISLLPIEAARILWSCLLLAASTLALLPLIQARAWLLVWLFAPILIGISAIGNVQPLIVAGLVLGLERRGGPLWIAGAASLKAVPILFVITYVGRRQYARACVAVIATALLVAPMLLFDLSNYPTGGGAATMLIDWPLLYAVVVGAAIIVSLRLARTQHEWLASSATVALALPRFFVYDLTFLMCAMPPEDAEAGAVRGGTG